MLKILIVDDDKLIRDSFADFFTEMKFEIYTAGDKMSALHIVREKEPEIIIVDYNLPDVNGVELIGLIKKIDGLAKFIIISGKISDAGIRSDIDELVARHMLECGKKVSDKGVRDEVHNLGIIEFIPKPVSLIHIKNNTFPKIQEYQFLLERRLRRRMVSMEIQTLQIAINALESKDKYTEGHSKRVMRYAINIANALPLNIRNDINFKFLGHAALLHDLGKIGLSEHLLNKKGRLTDEEFQVVMKHPLESERILIPIFQEMPVCLDAIRHHHERFNGLGYPDKLGGNRIPILSRIISVADAYDAMTSDRAYRKSFRISEAIQELIRNKNIQFDPVIVDAFIEAFKQENKIDSDEI